MQAPIDVLRLAGVHKTYRLGSHVVPALQGVDLALRPGEMLALTGPSGSGKSTILNIAGLIDRADSGDIRLQGQDVAALSEAQATRLRRDAIGFVFQGFNLVPVMSVFDNVDYPLFIAGVPVAQRRSRVMAMLDAVGLADHAAHRPDALSGGQRQRVAIARALVKRPALVIADEPTANLDSHTADQVLALRETTPKLPRGIVAQRSYDDAYWAKLTPAQRNDMLFLRHGFRTAPHFVAFWVNQLPAPAPWIARNIFGWQKPCYLLGEGYAKTFKELMETTDWDSYGTGKYEKCADCMAHCGYEPTAANAALANPLKAMWVALRGIRTTGPMAPEIDLTKQRPAQYIFSEQVQKKLSEIRRDEAVAAQTKAEQRKAPTAA